jgi:uncharacterized tellurite resistance protein B-like protein
MNVRDLRKDEWEVLLALLAHLAEADDRIDPAEVLEVHGIADEIGAEDVMSALMRARAAVRTRQDLLDAAARVDRDEARELMRTLLFDLAQADGDRSPAEREILDAVTRVWARASAAD